MCCGYIYYVFKHRGVGGGVGIGGGVEPVPTFVHSNQKMEIKRNRNAYQRYCYRIVSLSYCSRRLTHTLNVLGLLL